jgi:ribosomal protein S11
MQDYKLSFEFNDFLEKIRLKKKYINKLDNKIYQLNDLKEKSYKSLSLKLSDEKSNVLKKENYLVKYVIDITFSRTNTLLHVMDFSGHLKFFCSAGVLQYKGKRKKARYQVFRDLYQILLSKFKFIKNQPIALHLKNVGVARFWIIKLLKKKYFIKVIRSFNTYPHNGCRKKKVRRKKFRTRKKRRNG